MHNQKIKCPHCNKEYSKHGIGTHIWRVHGDGKEFDPNEGFKKGTRKQWNNGKTKETDERVANNGNSYSIAHKEGRIKTWCEGLTKETDERIAAISKVVAESVLTKVKNGTWHLSFAHSRIIEYNGIKFHGSWEVAYAKYLDANNIKWRRPTERFEYYFENKKRHYTPDFYLIDEKKYIEIKGYPTDKDRAKWQNFPLDLQIILGKELFEMKLIEHYKEIK
ncbi:MAG: hypothetical protein WC979_00750 [Candidatus Pacearchaeota archaeon]|jgi:hypothetical protein|nr:hypothetical protein [Clostridia bacterium]